MLTAPRKLNETPEHYELKQIAKYILWHKKYTIIGTEVGGHHDMHLKDDGFPEKCVSKNTIDVIGMFTYGWNGNQPNKISTYGIEAKASLADYKNGFCTACQLTSIIAPAGVIPSEILPDKIGLIEVNLSNYSIKFKPNGEMISSGIYVTKNARSRLAPRFLDIKQRELWAIEQLHRIAYRCSHENLFITPQIEFNNNTIITEELCNDTWD